MRSAVWPEERAVPPWALLGTFHLAGARTAVAAHGVAIIALFAVRALGFPIPATWSKLALRCAAAITTRVDAIVALLAEYAVDLGVATICTELAAGGTSSHTREAVRREVHAVIAFFGRSLLNFVPTPRPGRTIGIAMPIRTVVDAIVACFVAGDDSITALADALALYRDKPTERQVEVRSGAMTFRMEKRNFVDFAHGQTERRSHGGVNGERSRNRRMKSPKIERQAAVDEDPDIVVPRERKRFASFKFEPRANLARESEVVSGPRFLSGSDPTQPIDGEKLRRGEVIRAIGLLGERQFRNNLDVDAGRLGIPLRKIIGRRGLLPEWTGPNQRCLANAGVSGFAVGSEHGGDQPWGLYTAAENLEIGVTNAAIDRKCNDISEGNGHIERIRKRAGDRRARETRFDLAGARTAVAICAIAIVARFVVTRQNEAVAARRRAGSQAAIGLDFAVRIASVPNDVITVIARFVAFFDSVVAHGEMTRHAGHCAFIAGFAFTRIGTTVAGRGGRATIFAFFFAGNDPITTSRRRARSARRIAGPTILQLTSCRAAVVAFGAAVVAVFLTRDEAVATNDGRYAGLTGIRTREILFNRGAIRGAAITRRVVAVIAHFTWLNQSVPAAGGVDTALTTLAA